MKKALAEVVDCGVYGYNIIPKEYFPTIKWWLKKEQNWEVEQESRHRPRPEGMRLLSGRDPGLDGGKTGVSHGVTKFALAGK